jgi:hypothetical protein
VPKEMANANILILYNLIQRRVQVETDVYKKNIPIPVGHETRFTREGNLEFMLSFKRLNNLTY